MGNHMATPQALFDFANERWGPFDLDAAAEKWNAKCADWLGPDHKDECFRDGLSTTWRWHERVWTNPPWSKIAPFVDKAIKDINSGICKRIVMLLPARPCTDWWEVLSGFEGASLHIVRGSRPRFDPPPGEEKGSGGFEGVVFWVIERPIRLSYSKGELKIDG